MFDNKILNGISLELENYIINNINTKSPKCYTSFDPNEYKDLKKKVSMNIIKDLRDYVIKNKIYTNTNKFEKLNKKSELINDYNKNNILELSKKYDLPPLYILNIIFINKYNKNIIFYKAKKKLLDERDRKNILLALDNDVYTLYNKIDNELLIYKEYLKFIFTRNKIKFIEYENWFQMENLTFGDNEIFWISFTNLYGSCYKILYPNKFQNTINQLKNEFGNKKGVVFFLNSYCSNLDSLNYVLVNLPFSNTFLSKNIILNDTSLEGEFTKLADSTKTDKTTYHSYQSYYPIFLERYRKLVNSNEGYAMIEIGIDKFMSITMWNKYFPNIFIYGIDIGIEDSKNFYKIFKCDQSNDEDLEKVSDIIINERKKIFFIIDDGSHHPEHQIKTFNYLFEKLLDYGGCYIIEDIETSYWTKNDIYGYKTNFGYKNKNSVIEVFKNLVDDINLEFLTEKNRNLQNNLMNQHIKKNVRDLISGIFFGQNNIIILKKNFQELSINKREYRFKENL
jgi:hypothetical protein